VDLPEGLVLLLAGAFAGGFASGLAGFAFALVASSLWLHVLAPAEATNSTADQQTVIVTALSRCWLNR